MPLFEYRCEECKRKFTLLVGVVAQGPALACPRCGSASIRKLISRFRVARSEDDILDGMADPSALGDPEDPKAMADWMRRVSREMGEDLGDDFDELVEEAVREEGAGEAGDGLGDE
ncbi:MAG: putative regulatory protein FmdB [Armatimonadetes bacterium]|jgi:putative FmdB family regulatory protein|nr:putative regulatory protein FmdB [Armatimonadota bacterium]